MSLPALLSRWRSDASISSSIIEWRVLPGKPADLKPLPADLHPGLVRSLSERGIRSLYSHQASAWEQASQGKHIVVVTGTASGKTLCYNLPALSGLLTHPESRALYIFPTKALAQDQLAGVRRLLDGVVPFAGGPIQPAIYDGDTPSGARPAIRSQAHLVLSNPDMLHTGILPHHTAWADFFRNLRYVVIDEMHMYRGVFGSHVANVLRRLRRIARHYGARPQFILTSATIGNPVQLAQGLVEDEVVLIDEDGAARGARNFLIYNPPVVDASLGLRRSMLQETVRLADDLLAYDVQTIIFGRARRTIEVMLAYLRDKTQAQSKENLAPAEDIVRGYRSGYLPRQRREIEQGLRQGEVRAVVATNALELGIDIGGMGAALLAGYPGTIAATWQQAGRAGRGSEASLAVLVVSASPLDQFLAGHTDYFFGRSPEQALINPDNLLILFHHLRCAAFELPFQAGEGFGTVDSQTLQEFLEFLRQEGVLHRSGERYYWMADRYPAEGVSLRSTSPEAVLLRTGRGDEVITIGQVDTPSAAWLVHPGAIYLHEAQTYFVQNLDLEQKVAILKPVESDYYTEPQSHTTVSLIETHHESTVQGGLRTEGEVLVTRQVAGFRKIKWYTHETLGTGEVSLPPTELQTTAYWITISEQTVETLRDLGLWNNTPNDYGPGWASIRGQVRARDGYRCQVCGLPEMGREHHVHHKTPFRTFHSPELANQLSNLITLCPVCHRKVETAVRIRSGLAGLGYVLGQLAPLFLMCDTRDLGVHSDPEAPFAEGQPAVMIYDQVPAGIGFSAKLYELHAKLVQQASELVSACPCFDGCPSCVGPGGENGAGGKLETLALLKELVQS